MLARQQCALLFLVPAHTSPATQLGSAWLPALLAAHPLDGQLDSSIRMP